MGRRTQNRAERRAERSPDDGVCYNAYMPVMARRNLDDEECQGSMPSNESDDHLPQRSPTDTLLELVSLQKASGCWLLVPALAAVLGKTSKEVKKSKSAQVNQDVWATVLALIWLHGFKADAKEEWELLAMKAVSWLRAQNAPCMKECVEAGNTVLGCKVATDALGF